MINELRLSLHHVHTFNMDEYADQDGKTAPASLGRLVPEGDDGHLLRRIDPELRPPLSRSTSRPRRPSTTTAR